MFDHVEDRLRRARPEAAPPAAGAMEAALSALPARRTPRAVRRRLALVAAALALGVAGVVALSVVRDDGPETSVLAVGSGGGGRFPSETFTDWVSYADQVSVVEVVGERALAPDGGSVLREVTLRVEDPLWRRGGAPAAGEQVSVITFGWSVRDGERRPVSAWGGPRLEVGHRYVMPLVRAPRDGAEWTPLALDATLPLEGDRLTTAGILGAPSPIAKRMEGASAAELAAVLDGTRPDPLAAKHFDLPPDARWKAVLRERGG